MAVVKSVKIDGENIRVFKSAIYVFAASSGFTLELDLIVSEVVVKKYKKEDNLIIEIELEDGRVLHSIMHVKVLAGGLPQLNLFSELDDPNDYYFLDQVNENDAWFPNIEEGITIEEIRKVEMPDENIQLKLKLPIDQVEWLKNQKKARLNELFKEFIYNHWKKVDD
ncbi:hypothetical protein COJ85_21765 [Bacillus sp. AFS076308]|uniref:hypothetical protein n=1 Tax=unclassified Bacillus (in: firmicutes) TaxID=185979 RepID=UPI000BF59B45|nr:MULTISPECIES: hypothetical protein [unclassified Bacillus (in: firmicutes)]PFN98148.1 hypothetical protein COJ85_21765 [Bacillus sp. AFS076308]PGV50863.1 hypothetical protein COD92_16385 [Bacillus sp. AFS037270]